MNGNASSPTIRRFDTEAAMRAGIARWRAASETVALVPTMGALHEGHLRLVDLARSQADRVVVSVFVNPAQFGPNEDFDRYPRQESTDLALLAGRGADAAWLPERDDIYPQGFSTRVSAGPLGEILCGRSRPGHFDGVATVVGILLNATRPDASVFGEKDFQQLAILRRVHADLRLPGRIVGAPIVRETDGLAMSSRNRYLSATERASAPLLFRGLRIARNGLQQGQAATKVLAEMRETIESAGMRVDYIELRNSDTLDPMEYTGPRARLFIAAWLGTTRLIDNLSVE